MAKARARTTARKVKDKWKAKQWYQLVAPKSFNEAVLAESPAESPDQIMGRVATTTMQDLTGDFKMMHVKLHFQVDRVNGARAETRFAGHSYTSDYVRRLVRRNHSKISLIVDATTKDGARIRVKPVLVTEHRSQSSQQTTLRKITTETILQAAADKSLGAFVREMIDGTLANKLFKAARPIYPLRKAELQKSEVISAPTITIEDLEPPEAPSEGPGDEAPAEEEGVPEEGEPSGEEAVEEEETAAEEEAPAEEEESSKDEESSEEEERPVEVSRE